MQTKQIIFAFLCGIALTAAPTCAATEAQIGVFYASSPSVYAQQFMRGLDASVQIINSQANSVVPLRLVPLEIGGAKNRSYPLQPAVSQQTYSLFCAATAAELLPNLTAVFDLNNNDESIRYYTSNHSVLSFNVRDDAETHAQDPLSAEITARFVPYVWGRATNLLLRKFNWTQCSIIMSEDIISTSVARYIKDSKTCIVKDEYLLPAHKDENSVWDFFRAVDLLRVRPMIVIGSPEDFAYILGIASRSYYDFEFIWVAPPLHRSEHPKAAFQNVIQNVSLGEHFIPTGGIWCVGPPVASANGVARAQQLQRDLLSNWPNLFHSIAQTGDALLALDLLSALSEAINVHGAKASFAQLARYMATNPFDGATGSLVIDEATHFREGIDVSNWIRSSFTASPRGVWRQVAQWNGSAQLKLTYSGDTNFWHGQIADSKIPSDTFLETINVAMIYPTKIPEYEHWFHAADIAAEHITADRKLLPNFRWRIIPIDSHQLDDGRAVLQAIQVQHQYHPHVFIAAESNSITRSVQSVIRATGIPQISAFASADALSDKSIAPTFARTCPKEYDYGHALADLVKHFKWENVAILSSLDDYGIESAKSFISAAPTVRILEHAAFRHLTGTRQSLRQALLDIKQSKARIVLAFASAELYPAIMREAAALEMSKSPYVWILGEMAMFANTFVSDAEFPDGVVTVSTHEGGTPEYARFKADMELRGVADIPYMAHTHFVSSAEVYDAVEAIAYALDGVRKNQGDLLNGTQVYRSLLSLPTFNGASGRIAFDKYGDRLYGAVDIFNRVGGKWSLVASWRNESNDTYLVQASFSMMRNMIFFDGSSNAPTDLERLYEDWSDAGGLTIVLLTTLLLICVAGSVAIVLRHQHNPLIRASSPFFLVVMLSGMALALMSNYFLVGAPTRLCGLRYWFLLLGFALAYGSLVAKNWRVWRLWSDESMKIIRITNMKLFSFLGIFVLPFLILLVLWTIVDTPAPFFSGHLVACRSSNGYATWHIVAFGMIILAIGIGCFLSFKVRKIPQLYNECRHLSLATYNLAVAISIGLVLHQVLQPISYVASFMCWCIGVLFGFGGMFVIIFAPKFYLVILHPEKISQLSSGRGSTGKVGTTANESGNSIKHNSASVGGRSGRGSARTGSSQKKSRQISAPK